jgi:hypothetical protein
MTHQLCVYYSFTKLNKICKKRELAIYFENAWSSNPDEWISRRAVIAFKRKQTEKEIEDGKIYTRNFAKYSIFIDDKPFNGNIKKVLDLNKQADSKNVNEKILNEIYEACLKTFKEIYPKKYDCKFLQLELDL